MNGPTTQPFRQADRTILLYALADSPQFASLRGRQTIVRNALGGYPQSVGLSYFDREHAPIFFGREGGVRDLIRDGTGAAVLRGGGRVGGWEVVAGRFPRLAAGGFEHRR